MNGMTTLLQSRLERSKARALVREDAPREEISDGEANSTTVQGSAGQAGALPAQRK